MTEHRDQRLAELEAYIIEAESTYSPSHNFIEVLRPVTAVTLIGPFAVGKTTCMQEVEKRYSDFGMAHGFTTRLRREGEDPDTYRFYDHDLNSLVKLTRAIIRRELINYAVHPTSSKIYGTELEDYQKPYVVTDVMATGMEGIRRAPFGNRVEIGLVSPPRDWWRRVEVRHANIGHENTMERLREAVISLGWLLDQGPDFPWVLTANGRKAKAAAEVAGIAHDELVPDPTVRRVGEELLGSIKAQLV